ncbi:hypothetical protein QEG99_03240 [Mesomycoplasma lagogenitalium]|uniref:ZIP Zinc transporter n=1 Tax=Mesomycoplasma lagogenitalium TaxID=171286 RepID=A0ABY8LXB4_9BACT|nr:hypothetical protein QEG99_03240 [Mesomycoplasma lagogenitalium]
MVLLIAKIKPKIKKTSNVYLYALSAGMLLIIGTVGFIKEGYESLESGIHDNLNVSAVNEQLITTGIIGAGALTGISIIFGARYFFVKAFSKKDLHKDHDEHDHHDHIINFSDVDNPKSAWLAILLLLSHRTIDGFVLGATVARMSTGEQINIGLIVTFNIHILVEILIVYYRQVQYGQTIKKSVIYNLLTTLLLIPIMIVAAFINQYLRTQWWIMPFVNASGGAILTFVVIIELVPEFIHLRNNAKKEWYLILIFLAIGIVFTLMLLAFHSHEEGHNHIHEHLEHLDNHLLKLQLKKYI